MKHLFFVMGVLGIVLSSTTSAHACLNDRDTLALEAKARPDVLSAITGRFERNPPLFYKMRIAREFAQIANNPKDFDKYDDVAVAYDRIGDDKDALVWIRRKRSVLPPYTPSNKTLKEQWYRYYANCGTFRVHRWISQGLDRRKIGQMVAAIADIEHAVAIKPNAHFGREKYQLIVMKWIVDPYSDEATKHSANDLINTYQNADAISHFPRYHRGRLATFEKECAKIIDETDLTVTYSSFLDLQRAYRKQIDLDRRTKRLATSIYEESVALVTMDCRESPTLNSQIESHLQRASFFGGERVAKRLRNVIDAVHFLMTGKATSITPEWRHAGSLADTLTSTPVDEERTALSGLIELGGAWQSVDIFDALSHSLYAASYEIDAQPRFEGKFVYRALAAIAALRVRELLKGGNKSLYPTLFDASAQRLFSLRVPEYTDILTYPKLRINANQWQVKRTAYMMARLEKGDHPDTDPHFWDKYHPIPPIKIVSLNWMLYPPAPIENHPSPPPAVTRPQHRHWPSLMIAKIVLFVGLVTALVASSLLIVRRRVY